MIKPTSVTAERVPRVADLTVETFLSEYLMKNRPVIVTGAMSDWKALTKWEPTHLEERFGNERVQVYGDLFRLFDITTLSEYLRKYFGQNEESGRNGSVPYVRWYSHLVADDRVPWADEIFTQIAEDWSRPAFFPADSFVLPFCPPWAMIDPVRNWFPARGLFISARGARTRLHVDPWCSDALLCQIYGEKDFLLYEPSQGAFLAKQGRFVDVAAPDSHAFPEFGKARPTAQDTLRAGEMVLVPAGWYHHFDTVSDSISLTWNFVHLCRLPEFLSYVSAGPSENEVKQLAYAYFEAPGRHMIENSTFVSTLLKAQEYLQASSGMASAIR
ncbi:MAG TPA: cupin-like domain-containing protein [Terriglobales bacterium]|nr:cupin-like domain-containing protein [Terriglobales bacterium]